MATNKETPPVKVLAPAAQNEAEAPFTHYVLVPIDSKGKETGAEFTISKKGFNTYINRTATPEGNAAKGAKFKVKKKK